jgi:hypothetical protein
VERGGVVLKIGQKRWEIGKIKGNNAEINVGRRNKIGQ